MRDLIRIISYSAALKKYYLAVGALVLVIAGLNLVSPFFTKGIVDQLVANVQGAPVGVTILILLVFGIFISDVLRTFLDNINGYIGDMLAAKLNSLLSQRYYDHLLQLPMEYYDNEQTGRITSRLNRSILTISDLTQTLSNNFMQFFVTTFLTLVIIAFYSWPIALVLALLFPVYIWLTHLCSRSWQARQEGVNRDIDYSQGRFIETIGQIRVVKAYVQEKLESRIFKGKRRSVESQTSGQSREWHRYDVIRQMVLNVIFFAILGFIVQQTYIGSFTLGEMTLLLQLATQAKWPLFGSSFIIDQLQRASAGSQDYFGVMDLAPSIQDRPGAKRLKVSAAGIEYQNVNFAYQGTVRNTLSGISFTVESGSKLALVGESGEGKTTIANMLLRLYEPASGRVLIDGQDIARVSQSSLRAHIGVVFQDPSLFSGSVAENIRYGSPKASQKEVEAAARAANADGFIKGLSKGYDTEIGERGVKLSGGQKQRLAIARAILKDPAILILDEATSSLDSKAEREVQEALERLMHKRTTLIIAHRLSTIAGVDKIVGIKGGRIAETGSPRELAKASGIYAELLELQKPTKANKAKLKRYDIARV